MAVRIALIAQDGSSLTGAYDALRFGYPDVFDELKGIMSGEKSPDVFAGSADPDFRRLQIELKRLPPECVEELRPIFSLLRAIVQSHTDAKISGKIIVTEGETETKYDF